MRIPLTRYGLPQVAVFPIGVLALMAVLFVIFWPAVWLIPVLVFLFVIFCWILSFFRDPKRTIVQDKNVLYSPADGTVTDISTVDDSVLGPGALKIGIFLSVFNVHINRLPCSAVIEKVTYKKGKFKNAMSPQSSRENESNDVLMSRADNPKEKILVRQLTGAVARRIVCEAKEKGEYSQGEAFGMMKFGSRAELYLVAGEHFELKVKIGDKVRAGLTPLVRYRS